MCFTLGFRNNLLACFWIVSIASIHTGNIIVLRYYLAGNRLRGIGLVDPALSHNDVSDCNRKFAYSFSIYFQVLHLYLLNTWLIIEIAKDNNTVVKKTECRRIGVLWIFQKKCAFRAARAILRTCARLFLFSTLSLPHVLGIVCAELSRLPWPNSWDSYKPLYVHRLAGRYLFFLT